VGLNIDKKKLTEGNFYATNATKINMPCLGIKLHIRIL